jgi:hypothetical protein
MKKKRNGCISVRYTICPEGINIIMYSINIIFPINVTLEDTFVV